MTAATQNTSTPVLFLPGIIMPAAMRYAPLIEALGDSAKAVTKDLEIYSTPQPPEDYSIDMEVAGIDRAASEAGLDRFHLYGHSAGGACALAYAATNPDRLLSLALDEPATDFSDESTNGLLREIQALDSLPEAERTRAFVAMQLAPGVEPPASPPGPPPDWMANRPAGMKRFVEAIRVHQISSDRFASFTQPVYYSVGSLSSPYFFDIRDRLAAEFPNFTAETYEGLHHMQTSHTREPLRVAKALTDLWAQTG
ncbi:hypothetical protein BH23CHL5_BH23CHL5_27100 [soil metagenome]